MDIGRIFENNDLKISPPESPEDGKHRRHREMVRFYFALIVIGILFVGSLWGVFSPATAPEDRKWFTGIIGLVVGRVAGYLFKGE